MSGVLNFTLGLETSNFLRGIGLASGSIISLAGVGETMSRVMSGVWAAIERGGALNDLSARTGESVANLYRLQSAFDVVGIGSDAAAGMISRLQRAMGGIDEQGQKTDDIFATMGLKLGNLTKMDAPARLSAIASALAKMPSDQAAFASGRLFGRDGAGDIMQVTRDFKSFQEVLRDTAKDAALVARSAAAFDQIGDTLVSLKRKGGVLYTGIAEGIAPILQEILDKANKMDFAKMGENIGRWLRAGFNSITNGSIGEILSLSLQVAFEKATFYAQKFALTLAAAMMETIPAALQAAWQIGLSGARNIKLAGWGLALEGREKNLRTMDANPQHYPKDGWQYQRELRLIEEDKAKVAQVYTEITEKNRESARLAAVALSEGFQKGMAGALNAWNMAGSAPVTEAQKKLQDMLAKAYDAAKEKPKMPDPKGVFIGGGRRDVSDWEKMGWVFRGSGSTATDHARQTADNTHRAIALHTQTNRLLTRMAAGPGDFSNQP